MATSLQNLSTEKGEIPSAKNMKFGIVVAEWNDEITSKLLEGCYNTLIKHGAVEKHIIVKHVPGTFELTVGAQFMAEYTEVDTIVTLGCVIQGETRHFDFICQGVTQGITQININYNIPVIFGVLTTDNLQQALDRAGGKHGNKGDEAALTAIKMVALQNDMENHEKIFNF